MATPKTAPPAPPARTPPTAGTKKDGRAAAGKPAAAAAPQEVRIIGGQWKRTRLPVADLPGLRPTPDRVRETLFNWLGQDLRGWVCVDAFAGTGALGFEAASRGATQVLLVEQQTALVAGLQALRTKLQAESVVTVRRGDGVSALAQLAPASVDLVLLDPPFDAQLWNAALAPAARAVRDSGLVYLEAPRAWDADALQALGFVLHRHLKAGQVHAHLLKKG